ncbi:MAG: universal stress protein [Planctomycetota bacterium]
MSIAVLVLEPDEASPLVHWAAQFARARACDVVVLHPDADAGPIRDRLQEAAVEISELSTAPASGEAEGEAGEAPPPPEISLRTVARPGAAETTLRILRETGVHLLILPHGRRSPSLAHRLFHRAPCDTLLLRLGTASGRSCRRVLIPTASGPNARVALRYAAEIVAENDGRADALYIQPHIGLDAERVGRQILAREVRKALRSNQEHVTSIVAVANDPREGITRVMGSAEYDLLLIGATRQGPVRRLLFGTIPERLLKQANGLAVGVLRRAVPLTTRLEESLIRMLQRGVPQLDRDERLELVEKEVGAGLVDVRRLEGAADAGGARAELRVSITAAEAPPQALAADLARLAQARLERPLRVRVVTEIVIDAESRGE